MSDPIPKAKKFRKDARYSREEMEVISKYKQEYREQTTRELRGQVFKTKILVDVFNLWLKQGNAPLTEEDSATRMKELAAWVRNNWRPFSTTLETKAHVKVTAVNVVWETEKEAVETELKDILQVEQLQPNDPKVFQQRNAAAKRVIDKMSVRERAKLNCIVEERKTRGHPDHIRRDRAERYREKVLKTWSKERWLDMGMATITFTVHTDRQGRLVADVHDGILANVGLTGTPFTLKHKDRVTEMTRTFLDYMKSLRVQAPEAINPVAVQPDESSKGPEPEPETESPWNLKLTAHGYPILPISIMEKELSKAVCERLMRDYITQHYLLASGGRNSRVPYGELRKETQAFVIEMSVPDGFILNDPRNIQRNQIQNVLRHWCQRQEQLGPESAFGFRLFMGPKRKRMFAEYPGQVDGTKEVTKANGKNKKKGKQREVSLEGLLTISQRVTPNPSGSPITGSGPTHTEMQESSRTPSRIPTTVANLVNVNAVASTSNQILRKRDHVQAEELVRIGMRQMVMLKNLGHELFGPVNGPQEGLPLYEVPRSWLQELEEVTTIDSNVDPGPNEPPAYPRPRPLKKTLESHSNEPVIDPLLVSLDHIAAEEHQEHSHPDPDIIDKPETQASFHTAGVAEVNSGPGPAPGSDATCNALTILGKRSTVVRSPPRQQQAQRMQRRKVVTGDDLAYQEAQALLKGGVSKRIRKKKKLGH